MATTFCSAGIGNDRLLGSYGNDNLNGGAGYDVMTGGTGYDAFVFDAVTNSVPGSYRDRITDFQEDIDHINLSKIDANIFAAGNQAFRLLAQGPSPRPRSYLMRSMALTRSFRPTLTATRLRSSRSRSTVTIT